MARGDHQLCWHSKGMNIQYQSGDADDLLNATWRNKKDSGGEEQTV